MIKLDENSEIPDYVPPVLSAVLTSDYDEPLPNCGKAMYWLERRGFIVRGSGDKMPVCATPFARRFAKKHPALKHIVERIDPMLKFQNR